MDPKATNWAEMQSDSESDKEKREVPENPEENREAGASYQISMAKNQRKKPQMSSFIRNFCEFT